MFEKQALIYTARTLQDAFVLRNLLAGEGIAAVVIPEAARRPRRAGDPSDRLEARVMVARADANRARQVVVRFEGRVSAAARRATPAAGGPAGLGDAWPRCPQCDARRSTRCPFCGTAGSVFPPADAEIDILAPDAAAASRPSCGPGGCAPAGLISGGGQPAGAHPSLLLCPTCDEPFVPEYLRRCEWCGHEFPDGWQPRETGPTADQLNGRLVAALVALLILVLLAAVYLWSLS